MHNSDTNLVESIECFRWQENIKRPVKFPRGNLPTRAKFRFYL